MDLRCYVHTEQKENNTRNIEYSDKLDNILHSIKNIMNSEKINNFRIGDY